MQDSTDEHKLAKLMEGITVGSAEEGITRQLESTHLKSHGHVTMFGGNTRNTTSLTTGEETAGPKPSWSSAAPASNTGDEGWGDLPPAYTAISQDHRYGFVSILAPGQLDAFQKQTPSPDSRQAFARYANRPVSFATVGQVPPTPQQHLHSGSSTSNKNSSNNDSYPTRSGNKREM